MPAAETFLLAGGDNPDPNLKVLYHPNYGFLDMQADPSSDTAKATITFLEQPDWERYNVTNPNMPADSLRRALQDEWDVYRFAASALMTLRGIASQKAARENLETWQPDRYND